MPSWTNDIPELTTDIVKSYTDMSSIVNDDFSVNITPSAIDPDMAAESIAMLMLMNFFGTEPLKDF
ncbi:MAG: hypothetical protein GY750_03730 [Lentisphaerae bacterium]|nr:hypothetical protein [Lentisphaerota bacterium]MCP4100524.1 hypothetical protein [Lentisphaerota bacterium]